MRALTLIAVLFAAVTMSVTARADEINLFNGRNFDGWTFFLEEKDYNEDGRGRISDFATIRPGGVIELNPSLHGALMTEQDYYSYHLHVEWRWLDPAARNNTGIFLRLRPPFAWDTRGEMSRQYMVQIQPPNTGDLWVLGYPESMLVTDRARSFQPFGDLELSQGGPGLGGGHIRRHLRSQDVERPIGEWNEMDITLNGRDVSIRVNGALVNEGSRLADLPGRIGLESEFGPVQFRNIRLTPIE